MKLGRKMSKKAGPVSPAKEHYPGFDIQDEHAEQFMAEHQPKLGDEVHARVKLKVRRMNADEYGKRVGFDVTEMNADKPPAGAGATKAPTKKDVAGMLKSAMMANG